jgi:hypothetical protein
MKPIRRSLTRAILALALGLVSTLGFASPAQAAVPDKVAWVLWTGAAIVPSGTSIAATTVVPLGVGRYQVKFPGQATAGGIAHVTAVSNVPRWCQLEAWFPSGVDELVNVRCYRVGGVLDNSGFSLIFTRSSGLGGAGPYGYTDVNAAGGLITGFNNSGAANLSAPIGPAGQYQVRFPGLGSGGPRDGSLQATAVNAAAGAHCNIVNWVSSPPSQDVRVHCFNSAGAGLNTRFTLSYQQKTSLYGAGYPPKYFGYTWWAPGVGPATTNFNSVLGLGANTTVASGLGLWMTTFPRIGFLPDNVQVTAYGTAPNFCGLTNPWFHNANPDIIVRNTFCVTVTGAPVTNGFLISANSRQ